MNWEMIVGISSLVVAVLALGSSIWNATQSRKYHKISYRPQLSTWYLANEETREYELILMNNGLGPALIKSLRVKIDGGYLESGDEDLISKMLQELFPGMLGKVRIGFINYEHLMSEKEKIVLFKFTLDELCDLDSNDVQRRTERASLEIEYHSFYGERFVYNTDNHIKKSGKK